MRKRLGDILQERGLLTESQLADALRIQRETGEKLGEALIKLGHVSPEQIAEALSEHLRIPRAGLSRRYIQKEAMSLLPESYLEAREILPIEISGNTLLVAMVDPLNIMVIDEIQRETGFGIQPVIATAQEISEAIHRTTDFATTARRVFDEIGSAVEEEEKPEDLDEGLGDAPGVKLANMILLQAVRQKASDLHLEPREEELRVRFRIDGILQDVMVVPKRLMADVSSRIKIMAKLDITERRRPQDGRIQTVLEDGVEVDMRLSTLPTVHGEKIVARILHKSGVVLDLESFGFSSTSVQSLERILQLSQGLILVTGPTGSGKTTTLYGFLGRLNTPQRNIITVEDPVEYQLDGINQVQINPKVGLTFASGLRSVLRQDPDIIMVGEIRDEETAEIAVRSALTGHLVLSTLHTNSAVASITRLMDMGIEPYLLSSTVTGVIAQRLVRTICSECKVQVPFQDPLMARFIRSVGVAVPQTVYKGQGCPVCKGTGYRGRAAIEEVLVVNKALRDAIDSRANDARLQELALAAGMVPLARNAVDKLVNGLTTVEELVRTVYSVDDEEAISIG